MPWRHVMLVATLGAAGCDQRSDPAIQQAKIDRAVAKVADDLEHRLGVDCAQDHETPNEGETRNFFCGRDVGDGEVIGLGAGSEPTTRRRQPGWVERQSSTSDSAGRNYSVLAQTQDGLFTIKVVHREPLPGKKGLILPPGEQILKEILATYEGDRK